MDIDDGSHSYTGLNDCANDCHIQQGGINLTC